MNSYQSIGMYLYHTCCRSTRIFGQGILLYRSYWSQKHSIHKVTFFLYLNKFQLNRFFNSNHLNESVLKFRVV